MGRGDAYEKTAVRELEEELGIKGEKGNKGDKGNKGKLLTLIQIAKFIYRSPIETEMAVLYKTVWDGGLSLQPEEIKEGRFFTQKALAEALSKGEVVLSRYGKLALSKLGWMT